jgi:hypothetical protein
MTNEQIARVCHEANRAYCESIGDASQKPWDQAEEWQRKSAVDGVAFARENPNAPARAQHDSWMADKLRDGWKYGPVKDPAKKEHPCLVSYGDLPEEQRRKDRLFQSLVRALATESAASPVDKKPIPITGAWLRRQGDKAEMLVEVDGEWRLVAVEPLDSPFSHIAEPSNILKAQRA